MTKPKLLSILLVLVGSTALAESQYESGEFWERFTYSADSSRIGHLIGEYVDTVCITTEDSFLCGGSGWRTSVGEDRTENFLSYGPYEIFSGSGTLFGNADIAIACAWNNFNLHHERDALTIDLIAPGGITNQSITIQGKDMRPVNFPGGGRPSVPGHGFVSHVYQHTLKDVDLFKVRGLDPWNVELRMHKIDPSCSVTHFQTSLTWIIDYN